MPDQAETHKPLLTAAEVAEMMGVSARAVLMRVRRNAIPGVVRSEARPRSAVRFSRAVIERWLAERNHDPHANADHVTLLEFAAEHLGVVVEVEVPGGRVARGTVTRGTGCWYVGGVAVRVGVQAEGVAADLVVAARRVAG